MKRTYHGLTKNRVHRIWCGIKSRCLNKNYHSFSDYGGRGIKICDKWLNFNGFFEDMGMPLDKHSIDRVDNNGDYCKENCRWATKQEQANNTRTNRYVTHKGETKTIAEWSRVERSVVCQNTLLRRICSGWDFDNALTTPSRLDKFIEIERAGLCHNVCFSGETRSIKEWSRHKMCKVSYQTLVKRIASGWDIEASLTKPSRQYKKPMQKEIEVEG